MGAPSDNALSAMLASFAQWVCYRYPDKAPRKIAAPEEFASVDDKTTWATYEAAIAFRAANPDYGIGFVLTPELGITCVDLDATDDETIQARQNKIYGELLHDAYAELSPSGEGCHLWVRGSVETRKTKGVEVYSHSRYITITGNAVRNVELPDAQTRLQDLIAALDRLTGRNVQQASYEAQDIPQTRDRAEIINAIALGPQGQWFNSLWSGDWTTKPSASEADWQLCCLLMEHGATDAQVESIFLESQLGQRDEPREMRRKIRTTIKNARKRPVNKHETNPPTNPPQTSASEFVFQSVPFSKRGLIMEPMDKMQIGITKWLWYRHLPMKRLAILAGTGSAGKSTLTLKMAATVSSGGMWPDGTQCPQGSVLLWSGEDIADEDVLPRLVAMGADLSRIVNIKAAVDDQGRVIPFNAVRDIPEITKALQQYPGVSLVVISPLVSMVKGDMNASNITRDGLQSLVDMAQQTGVCVLGITHFRKDSEGQSPVDRVLGSAAFTQLPRIVMGAVRSADGTRRALAVVKGNNGKETLGAYEYDIRGKEITHGGVTVSADDCSEIVWGGKIEGVAIEIFNEIEGVEKDNKQKTRQSQLEIAIAQLKTKLADGVKVPTKELDDYMLKTIGIKKAVYKAAKEELKVFAEPDGRGGTWKYSLPDTSVRIDIPVPQQWAQRPN